MLYLVSNRIHAAIHLVHSERSGRNANIGEGIWIIQLIIYIYNGPPASWKVNQISVQSPQQQHLDAAKILDIWRPDHNPSR